MAGALQGSAGMPTDRSQDIRDRTFRFGCDVARLALTLAPSPGVRCLVDQLFKAGTAVGANLEEAKAGSSKRDFVRFVEIALREAREAKYWLRICAALKLGPGDQLQQLTGEADQIARILGSIVVATRRRMAEQVVAFAFCMSHVAFCILHFAF
jgi:four helix bundle protein